MLVYLSLTIITIALAVFVNKEDVKLGQSKAKTRDLVFLAWIFTALVVISAGRIAIGIDYWDYTEVFSLIMQGREVSTEPVFNAFVKICYFLFGFGNYKSIFIIFSLVTIFFFLKGMYDQSGDFAWSFMLFMAFGYYFSSFNTIRYYFALAICFYAIKFLIKKDYAIFVISVLLAATMHKALLSVLLLYPLGIIKYKKWSIPIIGVAVASLFALQGVYRRIAFVFYPFYEGSSYDVVDISYTNIARCAAVLILGLLVYKSAIKDNEANKVYFKLNIVALIIYTCCNYIPNVSRIGTMVSVFQIILIPHLIKAVKIKPLRICLYIGTALMAAVYYYLFMKSAADPNVAILPYESWIF